MAKKPDKKATKETSRQVAVSNPRSGPVKINKTLKVSPERRALTTGGKGLSKSQSDNLIPIIYILQAQSPQVLKKNAKYIDGAEAGDIWLRSAAEPIVKGEEGMQFQACAYYKEWVEWVPRDDGGGFVGRYPCTKPEHDNQPPVADAKQEDGEEGAPARWVRPNGNDLIFTRYYIGYVLIGNRRMPYVVPFSSTGHTIAKDWMTKMNQLETEDGDAPNMWMSIWNMTVGSKSNKKGDWFGWNIEFVGFIDEEDPQVELGAKLARAFETKEVRIDEPEEGGGGRASGSSDRM